MPAFNDSEKIPAPVVADRQAPIDTASIYQGSGTVDKLTAYIEGSSYIVTYYNRYIGADDTVEAVFDLDDTTSLQYQRIHNFELKVIDGSLTSEMNSETQQFLRSGQANLFPVIAPQVGDAFTATVDVDTLGLFSISKVERLTHLRTSAYLIDFTLVTYVDSETQTYLDTRVITELYFDANVIATSGGSPLQTETEFNLNNDVNSAITDVIDRLYSEYFDYYVDTFVITESEDCRLFDHFAVKFFNRVVPKLFRECRERPKEYDIRNIYARYEFESIWDAIREGRSIIYDRAFKQVLEYGNSSWGANFVHQNLDTSQIQLIIYPDMDLGRPITAYDNNSSSLIPYIFSDNYLAGLEATTWTATDALLVSLFESCPGSYATVTNYMDTLDSMTHRERFYGLMLSLASLLLLR